MSPVPRGGTPPGRGAGGAAVRAAPPPRLPWRRCPGRVLPPRSRAGCPPAAWQAATRRARLAGPARPPPGRSAALLALLAGHAQDRAREGLQPRLADRLAPPFPLALPAPPHPPPP